MRVFLALSFWVVSAVCLTATGGCASGLAVKPVANEGGPRGALITRLAHSDYVISIYSSPSGLRYDVGKPTGELLAENASLEQLQGKAPEIYEFMKSAVAIDAGSESHPMSRFDARVE